MNIFKRIFGSQKIEELSAIPIDIIESKKHEALVSKPYAEPEISSLKQVKKEELSEVEVSEMIDCIVNDFIIKSDDLYNNNKDFDLNDKDALFEDAARLIVSSQSGSSSLLQRRMKLGYNRAGRLMDQLETAGIVGLDRGSKVRDVLIKSESELQIFLDSGLGITLLTNGHSVKNQFLEQHKNEIEIRIDIRQREIEDAKLRNQKNILKAEILLKEQRKQIQKDVINELIEEGLLNNQFAGGDRREPIPQDVMDSVWRRDGGKCVKCGGQENLEFDHIIPFSKGGATTYRNMQILCKSCNIEKSNKLG